MHTEQYAHIDPLKLRRKTKDREGNGPSIADHPQGIQRTHFHTELSKFCSTIYDTGVYAE